jgi:hypothetical protein
MFFVCLLNKFSVGTANLESSHAVSGIFAICAFFHCSCGLIFLLFPSSFKEQAAHFEGQWLSRKSRLNKTGTLRSSQTGCWDRRFEQWANAWVSSVSGRFEEVPCCLSLASSHFTLSFSVYMLKCHLCLTLFVDRVAKTGFQLTVFLPWHLKGWDYNCMLPA